MICKKCNHHQLPDDSEFCQYCGNKVEKEEIQPEVQKIICKKCNRVLSDDSEFCQYCGNKVEQNPIENNFVSLMTNGPCEGKATNVPLKKVPEDTVPNEGVEEKKEKKHYRKIVLFSVLSLILVVTIAFGGIYFWNTRVIKQDINTVNGCPEFYNIEFGMTANEASQLIKLKHKVINGIEGSTMFEVDDSMKDDSIMIDKEEVFYLFGRKTTSVYVGFNEKYLDCVIFNFSLDDYKLKDIVSLYKKIYGEPTETGTISSWSGAKTTVDVFEYTSDDGETEIVVRYIITPNSQYTLLSFNGTEIDPCGFLGDNNAFNKKPEYYIKGLKKGDDYNQKNYSPEGFPGFSQYTLYPQFEYMGIGKGYTAIEFSKDTDEEYIGLVSYKFLLDEENAVDRMKYIHSKLAEKCGAAVSSIYTSTNYDKMGVTDVSFDEMIKKIASDTEGIYNVQWESNDYIIMLSLTISVDKEYYEGSVSFAEDMSGTDSYYTEATSPTIIPGTLTVGVCDFPPPFVYTGPTGLTGLEIDILNEIAQESNLNIEFKTMEWDDIFTTLSNKKVDCIAGGILLTSVREEAYDVTDPIYSYWRDDSYDSYVFYVTKDNVKLQSMFNDLIYKFHNDGTFESLYEEYGLQ